MVVWGFRVKEEGEGNAFTCALDYGEAIGVHGSDVCLFVLEGLDFR
jgi:hypothetical protein